MKQVYQYWQHHLKGTLRFRFATWIAGVLFLILIAFGFFIYLSVANNLLGSVDRGLQAATAQFASTVEVEYGTIEMPEESVVDLSQNNALAGDEFTFILINAEGQRLGSLGEGPRPRLSDENLATALTGEAIFSTVNRSVRIYVAPLMNNSEVIGVLYATRSLNDMQQSLQSLLTSLLISIPVLVIVAGGSGYFLAKGALAPISQITETARELSATDLSARLNLPPSNDEVGRLADTFDQMLERLDEAFQRERQFTADASHELRTPVMALQTILDVIQMRERSPNEYQEAMNDLSYETERLRSLLTSLLLLARGDRTWLITEDRVDLSKITHNTVQSLNILAEQKGLKLHATVGTRVNVKGNIEGLERVVSNLIENAIKYTEQGEVRVLLRRMGDVAELEIMDSGIGIAPEHIPHIFDRFYRVEQSRSSKGIGLGLSLVRQIVEAHAGTISVESIMGQGTTFTVRLPAQNQPLTLGQSQPEAAPQGSPQPSTST